MKFATLFVLTSMIGLLATETRADEVLRPAEIAGVSAQTTALASSQPPVQTRSADRYRFGLVYAGADAGTQRSFDLDQGYALGVSRFDVDSHTEIIGWKLTNTLYFGAQDGEDSGLSFVWQKDVNQVSLSKDGLRLTRRF